MLQLSRHIPASTKTIKFNWCKRQFTTMSDRYRRIRAQTRNPMDTCYWCGHAFKDGESIALAQLEKGANKTLCQQCADELLISAEQPTETAT